MTDLLIPLWALVNSSEFCILHGLFNPGCLQHGWCRHSFGQHLRNESARLGPVDSRDARCAHPSILEAKNFELGGSGTCYTSPGLRLSGFGSLAPEVLRLRI